MFNYGLNVHNSTQLPRFEICDIAQIFIKAQQLVAVQSNSILSGAAGPTVVVSFSVRTRHFMWSINEVRFRCHSAENMFAAMPITVVLHFLEKMDLV